MARKRKTPNFTSAKRVEYLGHLRAGMRRGAAAEVMGFERKLVLDLIENDEGFAELVEDAETEATEHVEEALYQAAISGNVSAAKMWLDLRRPTSSALVPVTTESRDELAELNELAASS